MFRLLHNFTHLTFQQINPQNSPSQASTVVNQELPDVQAEFRKGRVTRGQIVSIHWMFLLEIGRDFQKNIYFCFTDYTKVFDCGSHKLWKILKDMDIPDHLTCFLQKWYPGQETQVRAGHEQLTDSKLVKKYVKAVYCRHAYLSYLQSTSYEMASWMKHKLESRLQGKMSITSDMYMPPPL